MAKKAMILSLWTQGFLVQFGCSLFFFINEQCQMNLDLRFRKKTIQVQTNRNFVTKDQSKGTKDNKRSYTIRTGYKGHTWVSYWVFCKLDCVTWRKDVTSTSSIVIEKHPFCMAIKQNLVNLYLASELLMKGDMLFSGTSLWDTPVIVTIRKARKLEFPFPFVPMSAANFVARRTKR